MAAVTDPLDGIDESPEARIVKSFFAVLIADTLIASAFRPITLVENPTREMFDVFGVWSMAVTPMRLRPEERPSNRTVIKVPIMVSAFMPGEQTEETSKLRGLDLGNHIRKLVTTHQGLHDPEDDMTVTFEWSDLELLTPLVRKDGVRILSYQATYQTDIKPTTGALL